MQISLGKYHIRSFKHSDMNSLVKYADNFKVSKTLRDRFPYPYTKEHAEMWIDYSMVLDPQINFAIADTDELIGGIGLTPGDDINRYSAEIGYWLGEPFWGKGIVSAALHEFTNFAFNSYEYIRLFANVFDSNSASIRILEKAGYRFEGRLRKAVFKSNKFLDELVYATLKEEFTYKPQALK